VIAMVYRILLASIASRKAVGIMYSLRNALRAKIIGVSHRAHHPHNYTKLLDEKYVIVVNREEVSWPLAIAGLARKVAADLVIPVDFIDVATFSKYIEIFENFKIKVAVPDYRAVLRASNKGELPKTLKGIAEVPNLVIIKDPNDVNLVNCLSLPLVIKGLGDASRPEYAFSYELAVRIALRRVPCLVQEYAPGRARGYYVVAYDGIPLLEFSHERIVEYDPSGGASLAARGPILDPNLYALGRAITKHLKWNGPLMVETKWNYELGKYYVIELNPKFWGSLHLSVSLGFHFPAVLALAYLEGVKSAREFVKSLEVLNGEYYWVVDGIGYLAKVPETWVYMVKRSFFGSSFNDLHLSDPTRTFLQILAKMSSLGSERKAWKKGIGKSLSVLNEWLKTLRNKLINSQRNLFFIFDLDGTLIKFNVNWSLVKKTLVDANLIFKWETVSAALSRLWTTNVKDFYRASKIIENFELNSIGSLELLDNKIGGCLREMSREIHFCLATRQSTKFAHEALKRLGLNDVFHYVVGRDSGFGPLKESLFRACMSYFNYKDSDPIIVIDDDLINVITAIRVGALPIRIANNSYKMFQGLKLGIPSINSKDLSNLINIIYKLYKDIK